MTRKILSILLAILMVLAMVPALADAGNYTIKVLTIWPEDKELEDGAIIYKICEEYCAAHEGFSFEYEFVEQFDMASKLSILIASNDVPDIFIYEDGAALDALVERDAIVNLSTDFEKLGYTLEEVYNPAALSAKHALSSYEDIYSLPHRMTMEGIWYNKTIFEQYNLEVPTAWAELENVCDTLLANGVQPIAAAGLNEWPITRWIMNYATRLGGHDVHLKASTNDGITFNDPIFVQAAAKTQEMFEKGYFGKGFNSIDDDTGIFLGGMSGMLYMGSWVTSTFAANEEGNIPAEDIGFFFVPSIEGASVSAEEASKTNAISTNMAICFGKTKFDEGTNNDFLKYFVEKFGDYQTASGAYAAYNEAFLTVAPDKSTPMNQLFYGVLDQAEYATLWFEAKMDTACSDVALENGQLLAEGSMSPEEYCDRLTEAVSERMAG